MLQRLGDVLEQLASDDSVRVVILTGAGRAFSAGVDLKALGDQEAQGGGDVPEGVFDALRAALQLGRFSWRPGARKVLFFIGDAPPPYGDFRPLLSLVRQAHQEAGYRVHTVSVQAEKGEEAVFFFPEIAAAGAGASVAPSLTNLAGSLFRLNFPAEGRSLVDSCLASLSPR